MPHVLLTYVGASGIGEFTSFARYAFGRSATAHLARRAEIAS